MHRLILLLGITRNLMQPTVVGIVPDAPHSENWALPLNLVVIETGCGSDIAIFFTIPHI